MGPASPKDLALLVKSHPHPIIPGRAVLVQGSDAPRKVGDGVGCLIRLLSGRLEVVLAALLGECEPGCDFQV